MTHETRPPTPRSPDGSVEDGWGLNLAMGLPRACGVHVLPDGRGKTVGFELHPDDAPNLPRAARFEVD